jgi:hypothetical protein
MVATARAIEAGRPSMAFVASTWANETECDPPDWIEMGRALAERDEVPGAYNSVLYLTP